MSTSNVAAIGPVWPIEPRTIAAAASGHGVPVLTAIRTGRHGSYERLTLQFTSSFGEADVGYVPVVHADPSDQVVPLQGSSFLRVVVHGAVAHWSATPITAYTGPSTVTPGYPTLKQVSIAGDFEAVLSFGIGLDRTAGFQVTDGGYRNSGYTKDTVAYTTPAAGAQVASGSVITVYRSNGNPAPVVQSPAYHW